MSRILYKYLDIIGAKCMIGNSDLQFTNATQLNDPFDCHPSLIDHESNIDDKLQGIQRQWQKEVEENRATNLRNDTWLCSFSKVNDSMLMWSHYCRSHSGICIGIDIEKAIESMPQMCGQIYLKPFPLDVQYMDKLVASNTFRPFEPYYHQLATKAKDWEYEQEVRLVIPKPNPEYAAFTQEQLRRKDPDKVWDWKEMRHFFPISGECFESIYIGINTPEEDKIKIINHACKHLNPNIKIYQMQVDDAAFRLKAVEIK
jgi:hypothetical protein